MKCRPIKAGEFGDVPCEIEEATHIWLRIPGPIPHRRLPIVHGNDTRKGTNCWSWDDSIYTPTIKPSILTKGGDGIIYHSFVNGGMVQFLEDSTHEFAGTTQELLDVEEFE